MFTGIVKGRATVAHIDRRPGLIALTVDTPHGFAAGLQTGGSVSVDGVCLTAVAIEGDRLTFDIMQETLNKTTLGDLKGMDEANVERASREGQEIGGHPISGHVDTIARVARIDAPENNYVITFQVEPHWMRYIFPKGYIALNGTSLTIAQVDRAQRTFTVWLIPETLRLTTFGLKRVGDGVNLEVERSTQVIVETVREVLEERLGSLLAVTRQELEGGRPR